MSVGPGSVMDNILLELSDTYTSFPSPVILSSFLISYPFTYCLGYMHSDTSLDFGIDSDPERPHTDKPSSSCTLHHHCHSSNTNPLPLNHPEHRIVLLHISLIGKHLLESGSHECKQLVCEVNIIRLTLRVACM